MSDRVPTYFAAPSFRWSEAHGPVRLGNIIADPTKPQHVQNTLPFTLALPSLDETYQYEWQDHQTHKKSGLFGIWMSFLQMFGVGGELSIDGGKSRVESFKFERLTAKSFAPELQYLKDRMEDPKIQQYVHETEFKKRLYMITGLLIAHRPAAATLVSTHIDAHASIGVNAAAAGVPIAAGPKAKYSQSDTSNTSFQGGSDFVFGYQLQEIYYKRVRGVRTLKSKAHTKGAWYFDNSEESNTGVSGQEAHSSEAKLEVDVIKVIGVANQALNGKDIGLRSQSFGSNNVEWNCSFPSDVEPLRL